MDLQRLIFVSAVSNEFHHAATEQWRAFTSYRDVIKHAFHVLDPRYKVLTQEDLQQGFNSLLETLDDEVARSLFIIHLVGDLAGFAPQPHERRVLYERHPDLLINIPELRAAIEEGNDITYTQWELYLGFHHRKSSLIFEAQAEAPRSPRCLPTSVDSLSQKAHRRRIEITGHHRGTFHDQGDVARKCIRSFLHWRVDPRVDPEEPLADHVAQARANREEIVQKLVAAIKKPDPRAVPVKDPANTAAFIAAVRGAAASWQVNMATIVDIAATNEEEVRAAIGDRPSSDALYNEAFANLAIGDYTAACFSARRAADVALTSMQQQPENAFAHRDEALNALLLIFETAKAALDTPTATAALEEAAALFDKEAEPLRWADINQDLVRFLLDQAIWDRAEELINDIIDIREELQGEDHPAVAPALLLWCGVLDAACNYKGVEAVATRAEGIFVSQVPVNVDGVIGALTFWADAIASQNRLPEAEELLRHAVDFAELEYGSEDRQITILLGNLAELLHLMNRLDEAEPLMRRTLAISEKCYGPDHPNVADVLNNLGCLLRITQRLEEAENLFRRALAIRERVHGPEHPEIAVPLKNLGELLLETEQLSDAEPLVRRALAIDERSYGGEHPKSSSQSQQSCIVANTDSTDERSRAVAPTSDYYTREELR